MLSNANLLYRFVVMIGDFFAIIFAFVLAYILRVSLDIGITEASGGISSVGAWSYFSAFLVITPLWIIVFGTLGLYGRDIYFNRFKEAAKVLIGTFLGILLVIGYEFFANLTILPGRLIAVYGFVLAFILLLVMRQAIRWARVQFFKVGRGITRVVLVGSTEATKKLARMFANTRNTGYEVVGILGNKKVLPKNFNGIQFKTLDELVKKTPKLNASMVVQTEFFDSLERNKKILKLAADEHMAYRFIPTQEGFYTGNHSVDLFHGYPIVSVHRTALVGWGRILKRGFDIMASVMALIILSPFMLIAAIATLVTEGRPIIFKQKRLTRYNKHIYAYKFRSMSLQFSGKDQEKAFRKIGRNDLADQVVRVGGQVDFKGEPDPRITKVGRFIRKTSIDELPQLWNVIKGEMSLVGPRAIVPEELKFFKEYGRDMLYVKTGITGLAQVSGRSDISHDERAKLNAYYVQNWSFWMDLKIIIKTIKQVFTGANTK